MDEWSQRSTPASQDLFSGGFSQFETQEDVKETESIDDAILSDINNDWFSSNSARESKSLSTQRLKSSPPQTSSSKVKAKKAQTHEEWSQDFPESGDHMLDSLSPVVTQHTAYGLPKFSFLMKSSDESSFTSPQLQPSNRTPDVMAKSKNKRLGSRFMYPNQRTASMTSSDSPLQMNVNVMKPSTQTSSKSPLVSRSVSQAKSTSFVESPQLNINVKALETPGSSLQDETILTTDMDVGGSMFTEDSFPMSPTFQALAEELDREQAATTAAELDKISMELDKLPDPDMDYLLSGKNKSPKVTAEHDLPISQKRSPNNYKNSRPKHKPATNKKKKTREKTTLEGVDNSGADVCITHPSTSPSDSVRKLNKLTHRNGRSTSYSQLAESKSPHVSQTTSQAKSDTSDIQGNDSRRYDNFGPGESQSFPADDSIDLTASDEDELAGVITRRANCHSDTQVDVDLTNAPDDEEIDLASQITSGGCVDDSQSTSSNVTAGSKRIKRLSRLIVESDDDDNDDEAVERKNQSHRKVEESASSESNTPISALIEVSSDNSSMATDVNMALKSKVVCISSSRSNECNGKSLVIQLSEQGKGVEKQEVSPQISNKRASFKGANQSAKDAAKDDNDDAKNVSQVQNNADASKGKNFLFKSFKKSITPKSKPPNEERVNEEPATTPKQTKSRQTKLKQTTPRPISPKQTTPRPISSEQTTPRLISPKQTTPRPISTKQTTPRPISPKQTTSGQMTLGQTTPKRAKSRKMTPEQTTPRRSSRISSQGVSKEKPQSVCNVSQSTKTEDDKESTMPKTPSDTSKKSKKTSSLQRVTLSPLRELRVNLSYLSSSSPMNTGNDDQVDDDQLGHRSSNVPENTSEQVLSLLEFLEETTSAIGKDQLADPSSPPHSVDSQVIDSSGGDALNVSRDHTKPDNRINGDKATPHPVDEIPDCSPKESKNKKSSGKKKPRVRGRRLPMEDNSHSMTEESTSKDSTSKDSNQLPQTLRNRFKRTPLRRDQTTRVKEDEIQSYVRVVVADCMSSSSDTDEDIDSNVLQRRSLRKTKVTHKRSQKEPSNEAACTSLELSEGKEEVREDTPTAEDLESENVADSAAEEVLTTKAASKRRNSTSGGRPVEPKVELKSKKVSKKTPIWQTKYSVSRGSRSNVNNDDLEKPKVTQAEAVCKLFVSKMVDTIDKQDRGDNSNKSGSPSKPDASVYDFVPSQPTPKKQKKDAKRRNSSKRPKKPQTSPKPKAIKSLGKSKEMIDQINKEWGITGSKAKKRRSEEQLQKETTELRNHLDNIAVNVSLVIDDCASHKKKCRFESSSKLENGQADEKEASTKATVDDINDTKRDVCDTIQAASLIQSTSPATSKNTPTTKNAPTTKNTPTSNSVSPKKEPDVPDQVIHPDVPVQANHPAVDEATSNCNLDEEVHVKIEIGPDATSPSSIQVTTIRPTAKKENIKSPSADLSVSAASAVSSPSPLLKPRPRRRSRILNESTLSNLQDTLQDDTSLSETSSLTTSEWPIVKVTRKSSKLISSDSEAHISTVSSPNDTLIRAKRKKTEVKNAKTGKLNAGCNPRGPSGRSSAKPTKLSTEPTKVTTKPTKVTTKPTKVTTKPTKVTTKPTKVTTTPTKVVPSNKFGRSTRHIQVGEKLVFTTTSLNKTQKKAVENCATVLGAEIVQDVTANVTHLITSVDDDSLCPRTLKYMKAVLMSKWIVTSFWVDLCLEYGEHVSEEAFEVPGSAVAPDSMASSRSRMDHINQKPPLFTGLNVYLSGEFKPPLPPKANLAQLLEAGNAKVLSRLPKAACEGAVYHASADSGAFTTSCTVILSINPPPSGTKTPGIIYTTPFWLMNCIAQYKILAPDD